MIAAPIFDNSLGIFYQDLGRDAAWNAFGWHLLGVTIIVLSVEGEQHECAASPAPAAAAAASCDGRPKWGSIGVS